MKLEIGEKMYEVEYTINAVCDLEELTGTSIENVFASAGVSSLRSLLWCGLIENHDGLTMKQAGELLQEYLKTHSLEELAKFLSTAIEHAGFIQAQQAPPKKQVR
jgi:hypothetical protein